MNINCSYKITEIGATTPINLLLLSSSMVKMPIAKTKVRRLEVRFKVIMMMHFISLLAQSRGIESVKLHLRLKTHGWKTGVDFRSRKSESTFGTSVMQKRLRFSIPKIGAGLRLRLERVIFGGRFSEARDR